MQIRKVTPEDKENLVKLLLEFYNHTQSRRSEEQAQFRSYINPEREATENAEKYISASYVCFVADEDNSLKGLVAGSIREKKNRKYSKEGYVEKWYVNEEYQGKGIGKKLFDSIIEVFQNSGCTHVAFDTHFENLEAREIYEHMGFKKRLVTFFKILK